MEQSELQKPISQLFNALKSQCFACELFGLKFNETEFRLVSKNFRPPGHVNRILNHDNLVVDLVAFPLLYQVQKPIGSEVVP